MGGPIAGHLAQAGHRVTICSRSPATIEAWQKAHSGKAERVACDPFDAAATADVVITCVGDDSDLRSVMFGENGALAALRPGGLLIDHTTASVEIALELAEAARQRKLLCIDAPTTGGQVGAQAGTLSLMCGGEPAAIESAQLLMRSYASRVVHVGAAGAGQKTKMVNQVCIAGIIASLAEGVRLAQAFDLDLDRVYEAISGGAAQSWQMDNRWRSMAADSFDFGGAIDLMRKDLRLALAAGENLSLSLPVAALVHQFYAEIQAMGGGRDDVSALIRRLPKGRRAVAARDRAAMRTIDGA